MICKVHVNPKSSVFLWFFVWFNKELIFEMVLQAGVQLIHFHGVHILFCDTEKDNSPSRVAELFLMEFIPHVTLHIIGESVWLHASNKERVAFAGSMDIRDSTGGCSLCPAKTCLCVLLIPLRDTEFCWHFLGGNPFLFAFCWQHHIKANQNRSHFVAER